MNKKVDAILQDPHGIIPCDKDQDIYNVCSFSTDYRIVDMLIFECTCPSEDRSFCSHIRAVSKKFHQRYFSRLIDIYSVLNDINFKNSRASCIDRAENHYNLFLSTINKRFHFEDFTNIRRFTSKTEVNRYKTFLCAILRALSSISWRYYLIKTKDNTLIKSINYANNTRGTIEIDNLLASLDSSLSAVKRSDYSTVTDFLCAIESKSLESIGVFNPTSVVGIIQKIFCENIISNTNKDELASSIVEFFNYNNIELKFDKGGVETKLNGMNSLFISTIFKTIKRHLNYIDSRFMKESIDFILMDEFGLNLNILGIDSETVVKEMSIEKGTDKNNAGLIDLISLKMEVINKLILSPTSSLKFDIFSDCNLINIIYSAPILTDLYDYLFWYSANNQNKHGYLTEFLDRNIGKEEFSRFFFVRFSKNGNKSTIISSRVENVQMCIYKIVKPNDQVYSATHIYYSFMVDSIIKCDGINTLNYFMGGCIQENGVHNFIKICPKEILKRDISGIDNHSFNLINFVSTILKVCPLIIYVDLWEYLLTSILYTLGIEKEQFTILLSEYFIGKNDLFELNKVFHLIPDHLANDLYTKLYSISSSSSSSVEVEVLQIIDEYKHVIPDNPPSENENSYEISKCEYCLSNNSRSRTDCMQHIRSIQERFGIIGEAHDNNYYSIVQSYTKIINQSCKNLSIRLYTKIDHFIFELIQNADDNVYCSCIGKIPSIVFVLHSTGVLVVNNEVGFTEKDIDSICDIGNSSKVSNKEKIGNFGIGFKSVFSITNTPYIFSNGYSFMFNVNSEDGSYILPRWVDESCFDLVPTHKYYNDYDFEMSTYTTKFWLPYKENVDLNIEFRENMILFANKIRRVKLITNIGAVLINRTDHLISSDLVLTKITRKTLNNEAPSKRRKVSSDKQSTKLFLISYYKFKIPTNISNFVNNKKLSKLAVGIEIDNELDSLDGECNCDKKDVFSFLPIRSYGLKLIIQADFDLTSSRESISVDSDWNIYIRENIPNAIIQMISKLRDINGLHLLKKTLLNIIPTSIDNIDSFFLPVVSILKQTLIYEKCIYTYERTFVQPCNSIYINKSSKVYGLLLRIFPDITEFSYLLNKYSNKYLINSVFVDSRNILFEDLGVLEFNIDLLIDILNGIVSDYSYFGRRFEWYFDLFLLMENLINESSDISSSLNKIRNLPLFLTEEGRYMEPVNLYSSKNQLFFNDDDFPSLSKIGIHFISKSFILQLKKHFKDEKFNYNRIVNFIQSIGVSSLKSDKYIEVIQESLMSTNLTFDDHIYFTYLLAKTDYCPNKEHQIFAINTRNEFILLSPKNFHLFHTDLEKYSIIDTLKEISGSDDGIFMNLSYNKLSNSYLKHSDESFWNSFFSKFELSILPFYFERVEFSNLCEYKKYLRSCSKFNNDLLIDQHFSAMNSINDSRKTSIIDFYCHGIDSLAEYMSELHSNNSGNKYFEQQLTKLSNKLINCVCDFWDDIQRYWFVNMDDGIIIPSFTKTQFSTYPIFTSKYLFEGSFTFNNLCSPNSLAVYIETPKHKVISRFVNFLILESPPTILSTISEAFSSIISIDLCYLCQIIKSIKDSIHGNEATCLGSKYKDPVSYILLLELIIKESMQATYIEAADQLKKNMLMPLQDENKHIIWKNILELFWSDENILSEHLSLQYQFTNIYKLDISIKDIMSFFISLGVPLKPEKKHLKTYLLDFYKKEKFEIDSKMLIKYINIINKLYEDNDDQFNELLQIPIIKKNSCKWLRLNSVMDSDIIFSDSIQFHYYIYKGVFSKKKVIWSPLYFIFSKSDICVSKLNIDNLTNNWNAICSNKLKFKFASLCHLEQLSLSSYGEHFYYEIAINFLGPLYEESMKALVKTRKHWNELILRSDIIPLTSNININYESNIVSTSGFFDNKTNKLYVKSPDQLKKDDEVEEVVLALLTYISSFFPMSYPNFKSLKVAVRLFKEAFKEYELLKIKINWGKLVVNLVQKLETESLEFKVDFRYFLLSDYVESTPMLKNENPIEEEFQLHQNNCPKRVILEIGRRGEELAFNYLKDMFYDELRLGQSKIVWLNEIEESGLPYDILLSTVNQKNNTTEEIFIEVKSSSKKEKSFFYVSFNEWKFAEKMQSNYWIFQILGVSPNTLNSNPNELEYIIIKNPFESWEMGNLKMILTKN
ncbi:hypothetical protein OJ252_3606 [Cryptosporidium canis]|uniref:SWIM-type domain-containing protein n=1 Tax=Cryptosporidium canis TaxID=195482 RepID=A0ABQ8P1T9_9CRYT|nr:hypothetical protein OJ252_3606 [Cryptosporidium canis]